MQLHNSRGFSLAQASLLSLITSWLVSTCSALQNTETLRDQILGHLKLPEVPDISEEDFASAIVPDRITRKYNNMVWKLQLRESDIVRERKFRSAGGPSLEAMFRAAQNNPGILGDVVYSNTHKERIIFPLDRKIPRASSVFLAELRLFKKICNFKGRPLAGGVGGDIRNNRVELPSGGRRGPSSSQHLHDPTRHARVSIFHVTMSRFGIEQFHLINSRMVMVNDSGWHSFDITRALQEHGSRSRNNGKISFEVRVDSARPGRRAAEMAQVVRFAGQSIARGSPRRPQLVIHTNKEEEIKRTPDCGTKGSRGKCCRDKREVDFRQTDWSRAWIVRPSSFVLHFCGGSCAQSPRKFLAATRSQCVATETASLPVVYLVRRADGKIRARVAEIPDLLVERCDCASREGNV